MFHIHAGDTAQLSRRYFESFKRNCGKLPANNKLDAMKRVEWIAFKNQGGQKDARLTDIMRCPDASTKTVMYSK